MMLPSRTIIYICVVMMTAFVLAIVLTPKNEPQASEAEFVLEEVVPTSFGRWNLDPSIRVIEPNEEGNLSSRVYDQSISRGYRNENGYLIMLVVAYGHNQSDALQLHRPEVCYVANGFTIISNDRSDVQLANIDELVPSRRLYTRSGYRAEPVTYWTRVGDDLPTTNFGRQFEKLKYGLSGNIPDGVLVRVSSISEEPEDAYKIHDAFINDLLSTIETKDLEFFLGALYHTIDGKLKNINDIQEKE